MKYSIKNNLLFALITLALASCNLFIDDDLAEEPSRFKDVPTHSGEGYDTPITYSDEHCEVTYRFNDNVRYLDEKEQQYITNVKRDELGGLIEIHFAADTPEELLPSPGEIVVSSVTEKFDWGCNHLLQKRIFQDGVYKYLGTFAKLEETYKQLDIQGTATTEDVDSYYVAPDPELEDLADNARTRADDEASDESMVSFTEDGEFSVKIPLTASLSGSETHGFEITGGVDGYYKITQSLNFDNFSLDNMKFVVQKTVEYELNWTISGSYTYNKHIHKWHLIKGKAFLVGPVVLVFFLDIDANLGLSLSAGITFGSHKKTVYNYIFDLQRMTCTKTEKVVADDPMTFSGAFGGSIGVTVDIIFGIGIYGKVLSVRLVPSLWVGFEASAPFKSGGSWDASSSASIAFKVKLSIKLGVVLDISMEAVFGGTDVISTIEDANNMLDELNGIVDKNSDLYKELKDDKDVKDIADGEDKEYGAYITLGPWDIRPLCIEWTWFPKIEDDGFYINRSWSNYTNKMYFQASYRIEGKGILGSLSEEYVPALRIMKGSKYVTTLFDTSRGFEEIVKYRTYNFSLSDLALESDVMYTAYPCYFKKENINVLTAVNPGTPDVIDKGLPFCNTSPMVTLTNVQPYDYEEEFDFMHRLGPNKDKYYHYNYKVYTYTAVKGATNVSFWGNREKLSSSEKIYDTKNANIQADGTYRMRWSFHRYTGLASTITHLDLELAAFFRPIEGNEEMFGEEIEGPSYKLRLHNDHTYEIFLDDDVTEVGEIAKVRNKGRNADTDDDIIVAELDAIDFEGQTIWQRPDFHEDQASNPPVPFKRI
ncbi:MAG: hypothetical protein IJV45_01830 [Prevotella sp.]|nr:hypothetical protein [Prevotella sp.]